MGFDAHGQYDIRVQGHIFIVRFFRTWNLEGAKAFFRDYKKVVRENAFEKFGAIGDLRLFEGGTPETMAYFEDIAQWAKDHGQIARAQMAGSTLAAHMMKQASKNENLFPIHTFEDEKMALAWLADQGLDIG